MLTIMVERQQTIDYHKNYVFFYSAAKAMFRDIKVGEGAYIHASKNIRTLHRKSAEYNASTTSSYLDLTCIFKFAHSLTYGFAFKQHFLLISSRYFLCFAGICFSCKRIAYCS